MHDRPGNTWTPEPAALGAALADLARRHRWTWDAGLRRLLDGLPGASAHRHPVVTVRGLEPDALAALAADPAFVGSVAEALDRAAADLAAVGAPEIAYFSPEFAVSELVPQYSGGLGILAGDHLKAASDLGVPLVGVGLFYDLGFFRQDIGIDGAAPGQVERFERHDPADLGFVPTGVVVDVDITSGPVQAEVLRLGVGGVDLLALRVPGITDRLYGGDRRHRLDQELVLGVGGARALAALGIEARRFHLNEGHAGFAMLERLAVRCEAGASFAEAVAAVRAETLFTTHTPVPAGIERFDAALVGPVLERWAERLGVPPATLTGLGTSPEQGTGGPFDLAVWCLGLSGAANGVSALHGAVSRDLFAAAPAAAGIGHVTNGVHARTWVTEPVQALFDEHLGAGWEHGTSDAWQRAAGIPTPEVAGLRRRGRQELGRLVADRTGGVLDPDACTIGFARRFSTYKRAALLLSQPERLAALLGDDDRPVQFVFAGKAHPADEPGKAVLAEVLAHTASPAAHGRFHFVPDYDMGIARSLYAGCDVWLNNPVRPQEACGTSGMKAALNGALNCSVPDGWWDEWADPSHGWSIPTSDTLDAELRDVEEAAALHDLLAGEVVPTFHATDESWWDRVRAGWTDLGPKVTASRMLVDYRQLYDTAPEHLPW